MTVQEAAKVLEVSPRTVYYLCAAGEIPHRRYGVRRGVIRIDAAELNAYKARCMVRGVEGKGGSSVVKPVRRRPAGRSDGKPNRHLF